MGGVATTISRYTLLTALLVCLVLPQFSRDSTLRVAKAGPDERPNIILVVTDDQRADTLWAMPTVRKELAARGVKFRNGYVSNSLCCPSRATILTGNYSHTTGVYQNGGPHGGFHIFDDSSTIATWLDDGGYRTGLYGKYLNGYHRNPDYIPPGWDQWHVFTDSNPQVRYFNYHLNENGSENYYGHRPDDYATDVLKRKALNFVKTSKSPFFLYFAPHAPHELAKKEPTTAARRHRGAFDDVELERSPSFDEADVGDKPAWVQALPRVESFDRHQGAHESLLAVDEVIADLIATLKEQRELSKTLIVFTSDNGVSWGEHRWMDKEDPYRGSAKVPFVVRYGRLTRSLGPNLEDLVLNLDLAPTFAHAAAVELPGEVDGRSLLPLFRSEPEWRSDFLIEHLQAVNIPSYCGVRSREWLYVAYDTGEEELYDLMEDPYELENLAGDPQHAVTLGEHRQRVRELCSPPPPGYEFPPGSP